MKLLWTDKRGEWALSYNEILGFLQIGTEWVEDAFERRFEEVGRQPSDGEEELIDIYERETHGVGLGQFPRLVMAAALRDGVTAFEVHLEKARELILNQVGLTATHHTDKRAPRWDDLIHFYEVFGITVDTPAVKDVRDRRHLLTHKRGQIRREADRRLSHASPPDHAFAAQDDLELTPEGVREDLGTLDSMVRDIDQGVGTHLFPPGAQSLSVGASWLIDALAHWALDKAGFRALK